MRRPRKSRSIFKTSDSGAVIPFRSNLLYQKFLKKRRVPLASLAVSRPAALPPDGGTKPAKFHSLIEEFLRAPLKENERKFCGLCFLADARTSRFSPHSRASRGRAGGQKFISPTPPFSFCPPARRTAGFSFWAK